MTPGAEARFIALWTADLETTAIAKTWQQRPAPVPDDTEEP